MCKMCDDPSLTMADVRADMFRTIEKYGWLVQYVEAEPGYASFAYTVGLTGKDAPGIVCDRTRSAGGGDAAQRRRPHDTAGGSRTV